MIQEQSEALRLADVLATGWTRRKELDEAGNELRRLHDMNAYLLETLEEAYNFAVNHDDTYPFDWAIYCEMLYKSIHKVKQAQK